jgi:hypothetical protein
MAEPTKVERWTIYVCTGCGLATGRHKDCDAKREAVEVVPASDHDKLRDALELLRGYVHDDEGWKIIDDALSLVPPRDYYPMPEENRPSSGGVPHGTGPHGYTRGPE